jgi:hypothetical protein
MYIMSSQERIFYVCSYGGSGSKMLCKYLDHFGKTIHVHSRNPPDKLKHVGGGCVYEEWFNSEDVDEETLKRCCVIYIYRDPIYAIYSRFHLMAHIHNVQLTRCIYLDQVVQEKKDLYLIEEFFDNWTTPRERNYPIYCAKYENFFENIAEFNRAIGIPDKPELYPVEKCEYRNRPHESVLKEIYDPLVKKMEQMEFIRII